MSYFAILGSFSNNENKTVFECTARFWGRGYGRLRRYGPGGGYSPGWGMSWGYGIVGRHYTPLPIEVFANGFRLFCKNYPANLFHPNFKHYCVQSQFHNLGQMQQNDLCLFDWSLVCDWFTFYKHFWKKFIHLKQYFNKFENSLRPS